jgi:hypothetical protein
MIPCACNNYSLCYTGYQYITITFNTDWLENQFECDIKVLLQNGFQISVESITMMTESGMYHRDFRIVLADI